MTVSSLFRTEVPVRALRRLFARGFAMALGMEVILVAGMSGCEGSGGMAPAADLQALAVAVRKWKATAPPHYEYTLEKYCFCSRATPLRVTVRNGVVERAQVIATGALLTGSELEGIPTIPGVFTALAYALDLPAASYSARFDARWGFPTEASIDHWAQAVDDEVTYRLRDFEGFFCFACMADATLRP